MTRILHCIWRMSLGGAERQLVQLCSGLVAKGLNVHVATAYAGPLDRELAATGVAIHQLHPFGKYDVTLIPRMMFLLKRLRPDVVATWLTQMDIVAGIASRAAGVPWILCERSSADAYPNTLLHRARAGVAAHADAIVANSEGGREYWSRYVDVSRISVIPNIVPLSAIESVPAQQDESEQVILYVGRFSLEKNLDRLVDALASILPGRRAKAVFLGEGQLRKRIEQKAADLGISDQTVFLGEVPNVWEWMKRAAVVVAVSVFEGNPNVVLEAIACGAPLVASDIPAHRALVGDDSARLVNPLSAESIADGIAGVLGSPSEARERAERARSVIAGRSPEDIAGRYAGVFDTVIGRR